MPHFIPLSINCSENQNSTFVFELIECGLRKNDIRRTLTSPTDKRQYPFIETEDCGQSDVTTEHCGEVKRSLHDTNEAESHFEAC